MVASYLPYPLFSGGHIRLYNLMKNLTENGHEITLICEKRDYQTKSDVENLEKISSKVIAFDRKKQWSPKNILNSGFSTKSFLSVGHSLPEMKSAIQNELNSRAYDLIHIETYYVYQNVPETLIPQVLVEHNIEYLVYKRYVEKAPIIARPFLSIDVVKMKKEEKYFWKKATKLIAVSPQEKGLMGREDTVVVANGVDIKKFDIKRNIKTKDEEKRILFIGDFKWIQNKDAVEWIIKSIWPSVLKKTKARGINVKFWVVGKRIPKFLLDMADSSIIFDENAPAQTEEIYKKADLLLAPIRIGGGTSFKILESMATGLPVLTTALGNEGINGKEGEDMIIAEKPEEYVSKILELLEKPDEYKKISDNSRDFVKKNFDWKNISLKLEDVYRSAVK
jgi:glycosyltransferase involved in cell wall biosynthesis